MADGVNEQMLGQVRVFHEECGDSVVNADVEAFLGDPEPSRGIQNGTSTVYSLFTALLNLQHRGKAYRPFLEALGVAEAENGRRYEWLRDHVVHSSLVYCVGIYLYMSFARLRAALETEMMRSEIEASDDGLPRYSKDTPQNEFAFRWRLAALCHDIAYPFEYPLEMSGGTRNGIRRYLKDVNASLRALRQRKSGMRRLKLRERTWFDQLNQLPFAECTALELVEQAAGLDSPDLSRYWWSSRRCGYGPDHGIASAVFIYRMADLLYEYHNRDKTTLTPRDMWYPRWLVTSIAHALAPIAYHKLTPTAGDRPALERLIADRPLVGLLRMADALQCWDREYFHEKHKCEKVPASSVCFKEDDALIMLVNGAQAKELVSRINEELSLLQDFPVKARALQGG